ncbi:MAG: hypothetical protein IT369_10100 [Candidatus Latescibacteria bacterium]|nr:hypothetical protein [Candidatus Latescibacterota bacterium]
MDKTAFENRLSDYVRGELPAQEKREVEAYLEAHPEVLETVKDVEELLGLTRQLNADRPPPSLMAEARAELFKQLEAQEQSAAGWQHRFPLPKCAYLSGLAASLAIIAFGLWWAFSTSEALAGMIANLKEVHSLKVEGWIRGEDGSHKPYRQWLQVPYSIRAEIGEGDRRRVVIASDSCRQVQGEGGTFYQETFDKKTSVPFTKAVSLVFSFYENPRFKEENYRFEVEELGDVIRYTIWASTSLGTGPSERKHQIEVDRHTRLPSLVRLWQLVEGEWVEMSELHYGDYNASFPAALFQMGADAAFKPLDEQARQRFWFEWAISPLSVLVPAVHVPAGGIEVSMTDSAFVDPSKGSSGWSSTDMGGVTRQEFYRIPLREVVSHTTGLIAANSEVADRRVSLIAVYKTALPWPRRLQTLLRAVGLDCDLSERQVGRTYFVFRQDGRKMPPSKFWWGGLTVQDREGKGNIFSFKRVDLSNLVTNLFLNSKDTGFDAKTDTLEFTWNGPPEQNPFNSDADLEFVSEFGTWEENARPLREQFGVELERVAEQVTRTFITLKPASAQ